jgi:hypothetical protein
MLSKREDEVNDYPPDLSGKRPDYYHREREDKDRGPARASVLHETSISYNDDGSYEYQYHSGYSSSEPPHARIREQYTSTPQYMTDFERDPRRPEQGYEFENKFRSPNPAPRPARAEYYEHGENYYKSPHKYTQGPRPRENKFHFPNSAPRPARASHQGHNEHYDEVSHIDAQRPRPPGKVYEGRGPLRGSHRQDTRPRRQPAYPKDRY